MYHSAPEKFCGLVGVKSTGKTTTLEYLASEEKKNGIYLQINPRRDAELDDILWARMRKSVYTLPWILNEIRLNPEMSRRDRIEDVFRKVHKLTNEKVVVVADLTVVVADKRVGIVERMLPSVGPSVADNYLHLDTNQFTRDVKNYVSDLKVMCCVFAASEGLMFQAESHREARLGLFLAKELSLEVSRNYLQKVKRLKPEDVNDELLQQFPRTFTKLRDFAGADDRREFADESLKLGVYKIKEAKEKSLNADLYALLKLALERPIDIDDYVNCRLSKTKFIELCVQSNILQPTRSGDYEIQFDVTRKAIENVLGE